MEVDWSIDSEEATDNLNLHDVNSLEASMAVLLHTSLKLESEQINAGLLPQQKVLAVDLHVKNVTQKDSTTNAIDFHMNAMVDVLYVANANHAVQDMASVLIRLARQEQIEEQISDDIYSILGNTANTVTINFRSVDPPSSMLWEIEEHVDNSGENTDKALILACTLLCASLLVVTAVLLYVVGGWRDLREKLEEQMDWIKSRTYSGSHDEGSNNSGDEESGIDVADSESVDDQATNPSGILGAASNEEHQRMARTAGLGIHSTPERGIDGDAGYDTTPFSEMSQYTDSSRAPLGISSMRKMDQQPIESSNRMMSLPPLAYQ